MRLGTQRAHLRRAEGGDGRRADDAAAIVDARSILTYTKDASGKVTFRDKVTGAAGEVVLIGVDRDVPLGGRLF